MFKFSILAPVPEVHLADALDVCAKCGSVAFGSNKYELFESETLAATEQKIPLLIYASKGSLPLGAYSVTWIGFFDGYQRAKANGRHPEENRYRPSSTDTDGKFAGFWHVSSLKKLDPGNFLPVRDLQTKSGKLRLDAAPRGPELVQTPMLISELFS